MLFRTTDNGRWGPGIGVDLNADQIDGNFWELRQAINGLIANPGKPIEISSITVTGSQLTLNMSDGSILGPINLPVLSFKWRGDWLPTSVQSELDVFRVAGVGLYLVLKDHISPAVFDPAFLVGGNPAYLQLFAFAPAQNLVYDAGFYYPGKLSDLGSDVTYMYQEPVARKVLLPTVPAAGSAHQAYLQTASTVSAQDFNVYRNDVAIGTIHFAVGVKVGTVTITANTTFDIGNRLATGKALVSDPSAAGLSVVFAAQQVAI